MSTKLTLKMKQNIIAEAKHYAKTNKKSLSRLVSDYFISLSKRPIVTSSRKLPPLTKALSGILKSTKNVSEKDYDKYREDKYL
jgi:hypothetical protein